ncbi:MAG: hypothetical protein BWZ01_01259 [Deltaproteobacteria bacterium ADurb.BinA179]|nr:hypothetical protein [Deltaproteobacteria bacterium]MDI9542833.1 hypothetical protein [Pseudomonadota bacterium]NLW68272.1 hypothetical protein [Bacteriovoracaceae bacterium]OPZ28228.1 MAG: hypothetical protein BWZ01_01259 [Deltaproteobacteria bacterium ADurb.BinA179]HOD71333.1 hypothetical protein [Deltaproteobacteria bacterium]
MNMQNTSGQTFTCGPLVRELLDMIGLFDRVQRRFHPAMIQRHRETLHAKARALEEVKKRLSSESPGLSDGPGCEAVLRASELVLQACGTFGASDDIQEGIFSAMRAMRKICRAREILFDLRYVSPEIDGFFRETPRYRQQGKSYSRREGDRIIHFGLKADPYARGNASLFVPEPTGRSNPLSLVIALHGGFGHGRDFIWTWIREARTRGLLLMSPTSLGKTWGIESPEADLECILGWLDKIAEDYPVDRSRTLLTGLSDGGTFALGCAMLSSSPFSAYAPVSCVLPPGDVSRAAGRRIRWVHGLYDWMFPVDRARRGCAFLKEAGAEVVCRIVDDLAHAYPGEENGPILAWFDSGPALPAP